MPTGDCAGCTKMVELELYRGEELKIARSDCQALWDPGPDDKPNNNDNGQMWNSLGAAHQIHKKLDEALMGFQGRGGNPTVASMDLTGRVGDMVFPGKNLVRCSDSQNSELRRLVLHTHTGWLRCLHLQGRSCRPPVPQSIGDSSWFSHGLATLIERGCSPP